MAMSRSMDRYGIVYSYNNDYATVKMNEPVPHKTTWMDITNIVLNTKKLDSKSKEYMITFL